MTRDGPIASDAAVNPSACGAMEVVDLTARFGADEARTNVLQCIEIAARDLIAGVSTRR
jgi:hypothetical protein